MTNITVRMSPEVEKYLDGAKSKSGAANHAMECWIACETHAKRRLKGKFTVSELCAFIDLMNSTIIPVTFADSFRHEFEDGCAFECLEEKWDIEKDVVLSKMDTMSMAEYIVLVQWSKEFWDDCNRIPEEYAKTMA